MREKITEEEICKRIFKQHGNNVVLLWYSGDTRTDSLFLCSRCGNKWESSAENVYSKRRIFGCPICSNKNKGSYHKHTLEEVKKYVESQNCRLISEEYKNCDENLLIEFSCGHIGDTSFYNFKKGVRCDICGWIVTANSRRIPVEEIYSFLKENEIVFVSFPNGYKGCASRIITLCKTCGNPINKSVANLLVESGRCRDCVFENYSEERLGNKGSNWQGGKTKLRVFLSKQIREWKLKSAEKHNYKCVVTGNPFQCVHHLYSFKKILDEALRNLGYFDEKNSASGEYSQDELMKISDEFVRLHWIYPLGIPLAKKVHIAFHKMYGKTNNTPEQFYEFVDRINSGEIQIPE